MGSREASTLEAVKSWLKSNGVGLAIDIRLDGSSFVDERVLTQGEPARMVMGGGSKIPVREGPMPLSLSLG